MGIEKFMRGLPQDANFGLQLALGRYPECIVERIFAVSAGLSTTWEDIWDAGTAYTPLTTGTSLEIVSSDNTNDKAGGTGALTVLVEGISAAYALQSEVVIMNGTTAVSLTKQYLNVHRVSVVTAGTSGANTGTITLRVASAGATQATIVVGYGVSRIARRVIPVGYTGILMNLRWVFYHTAAMTGQLALWELPFGGAWGIVDSIGGAQTGVMYPFRDGIPHVFSAKSRIRVTGLASTSGSAAVAADLVLVPD